MNTGRHFLELLQASKPRLNGEWQLQREWQGSLCKLSLKNTADLPQRVGELTLFCMEMPFSPDTEVYGEGYNMLSQYGGTVRSCDVISAYSDYAHYKLFKPEGVNQVYNLAVFSPKGQGSLLIGFSSCFRFVGAIRFNEQRLEIVLNCENVTVKAGETIALEQLCVEWGEKNDVLRRFANAISQNHPMPAFPEIPTGWCSWLVYGPNVTAKRIYDNLDAVKEKKLNLKYVQIDDGYQAAMGDWLETTDRFEGGVKQVCLDIKARGFEPAIWVAPFIAEKNSKLFREHPDWFVKDDDQNPLSSGDVSFGGWRYGPWYMLDPTHPQALDYLKNVFQTMRNEWKVTYFKLDANMWGALPVGKRYDADKTCVEAYRIGMNAILEAVGEGSFVLGCNAPMWPSIGVVHGMRVTNDNNRKWSRFYGLLVECFHRNWQHNRLWINDPDTVLLQNKATRVVGPDGKAIMIDGTITNDEFMVNAVYTMASGGMVLSGDDLSRLTDENLKILKKLLPPVRIAAEFTDSDFTVGTAKIDEQTTAIYTFNLEAAVKDIVVAIDGRQRVYDVFAEQEIGVFEGEMLLKNCPPHSARAFICTSF